MNNILLFVIIVALAGVTVFLISLMIELRKTVASLRKTTENSLNPLLDELQLTVKSLRGISDNINDVTEDVKQLSHSVGEVGNSISALNRVIGDAGQSATVRAKSLRTGAMVALEYLVANLFRKGEEK